MTCRTRPIHETFLDMTCSIELQLRGETKYIPVWVGRPGIGKSTIIKQIAKERGMFLYYVTGAKPLEFWMGLPITNTLTASAGDDATAYTVWTCPEIIHKANELAKLGEVILFLDDLQVLDRACQRHFFEFVLERKLHGYHLAPNVAIVAAANSSIESGNEGFFAAINNRFQWIHVHMDFNYWYTHIGLELHPLVAGFLSRNLEFVEEDESTTTPFATYRSWTEFSHYLTYRAQLTPNADISELAYDLATGFVSQAAAQALKTHIQLQSKFNFAKILQTKIIDQINMNDAINQVLFANIVRYIDFTNSKHVENFMSLLKEKAVEQKYANLVSNCILELKNLMKFCTSKNDVDKADKIKAMLADLTKSKSVLSRIEPLISSRSSMYAEKEGVLIDV